MKATPTSFTTILSHKINKFIFVSANRLGPECFGLTVFDEFLSLFVLSSIHISFDKSIYFYPDEYGSRALDHAFFRFLSGIVRQIWSKSALITITWKVFKRFVVFPKADPFESFQCQLPTIPANAGGHRIKLLAKKIFFRSLPFSPFFAFFLPFSLGLPFFPFPSSPLDFLPFLFGPSLILSISFLFNFSPYHSQLKIFVQTN